MIPQIIIPAYVVLVSVGAPIIRAVQMKRGLPGFSKWSEFWSMWSVDLFVKLALLALLYWGGFWN